MPAAAGLHTLVPVAAAFIWVGEPRESEDSDLAEAGTVLIAVRDSVLADSLRFSLELEGYEARLCQPPIERLSDLDLRTCLLLDQEVFSTLWGKAGAGVFTRFGLPTVLMVNQRTRRLMDHANAAGVTAVVEKPLLGGVLFEAIRSALDADAHEAEINPAQPQNGPGRDAC
jgi:DNA-binding NtrC family response regulator